MTRLEFTRNAIVETISEITDEGLLDYFYSVIMSALTAETRREACLQQQAVQNSDG